MLPNIHLHYSSLLDACAAEGIGTSIVELIEFIPECTTYTAVKAILHIVVDLMEMYLEEGIGTTVFDECATFLVVCSDLQQSRLPVLPSAVIVF